MTTRQAKQEQWMELRDKMLEVIQGMNYWPLEWHLSVKLSPKQVDARLWRRRHKKLRSTGPCQLSLVLLEDWLERVHARGWAVLSEHFILHAQEVDPVPGMDQVLLVETAYPFTREPSHGDGGGHYSLHEWSGYMALYGGQWGMGHEPWLAAEAAMRPFIDALEDPETPF